MKLVSNLLIPFLMNTENKPDLDWLGTLQTNTPEGFYNEIQVIGLNCKNKAEMRNVVEECIKLLEKEEQTPNVQNNIRFMNELLDDFDDVQMQHTAPQKDLDNICQRLHIPPLKADEVVYFSGVDVYSSPELFKNN